MCTVLLPPGGYPIEVNKYIISYYHTGYKSSVPGSLRLHNFRESIPRYLYTFSKLYPKPCMKNATFCDDMPPSLVSHHVTEEGNIQSLRLHTFTSLPTTMKELTWSAKLSSSSVSNSPFGGKHISFDRSVLLDPWNIQNPCYNPCIILFYDDAPARFISAITVFT